MGKLILSVSPYPRKEITLDCRECGKRIKTEPWADYAEYKRKMEKIKKYTLCPFCSVVKKPPKETAGVKWERTAKGDYMAKVANGDFLVFKWGNGLMPWRWRFRRIGEELPERIRVAKTKEEAMKECEQHEEWKV